MASDCAARQAQQVRQFMNPIDVFHLVVEDWMARRPKGKPFYFVQLGAHDGREFDPIHEYVMKYGWTGVLVEPQIKCFEQLKKNYSAYLPARGVHGPGLWFENSAIGRQDGEMSLYRFADGQGLPYEATMLATCKERYLQANGLGYVGKIIGEQVPCLSVPTFCKKYPMAKLDLLQVDIEGIDAETVRAFLAEGVTPAIIHFESYRKSQEHYKLLEELQAADYALAEVGVNTVCYQQRPSPRLDEEQAQAKDVTRWSGVWTHGWNIAARALRLW